MKALVPLVVGAIHAFAANPYLALRDDKPVAQEFTGERVNNETENAPGNGPVTATVTTQRIAKMAWGEIYHLTFKTAPADFAEQLPEYHLLVTDNEILRLVSSDMDREIRVIRGMRKQPRFEPGDVLALSKGKLRHQDGLWITEIQINGDTCKRASWHDGAGHFSTLIWRKGAGLVEIAAGRGADLSNYRLRAVAKKPAK